MSYRLDKPYTNKEKALFVDKYQGLKSYEDEQAFYFLEANEIVQDNEIILNPNYESELAQQEKERIGRLNMTKADFWLGVLEKGITKQTVLSKIQLLPDETQRAKAMIQFEDANNYWRGNEFMDVIGAMFGITPDELDYLFENKQFPVSDNVLL